MRKLILLVGLLGSAGANAADNGIYVGVGLGQSNVEREDISATADFEGEDLGYKVIFGIRPLDWLGFEANYVNFGEPDDTIAGTKYVSEGYGITGSVLGFLSLGPVDVFARAGAVSWDTKVDQLDSDLDGTDLVYGGGAQFRVLSLSIRAEYEVFDIEDVDTNMLSLSVTYTFL